MIKIMKSFTNLPIELVNNILSFDKHFRICRGIPQNIIPKDDTRYTLLKRVCRFSTHLIDISDSEGMKLTQRFYFDRLKRSDKIYGQDGIFVVITEENGGIGYYIEHTRLHGSKKHLYYSYNVK